MNMIAHINEQLDAVKQGGRFSYPAVTIILETYRDQIQRGELTDVSLPSAVTQDLPLPSSSSEVVVREEQTPVRTPVSKWSLGVCKRCGKNGVKNGDIVVKIHGKGWWHDECYRIVRPSFYVGID